VAVSVISDIVMDVVRAADPADVQVAQAKLRSNQAAFAASSLAETGNGFAANIDRISSAESRAGLGNVNTRVARNEIPDTYRQFEASVLQTFVQNMMPQDSEELYGKGSAGEIYKGMMAEQFAKSISESGGIGIAEQVYTDALRKARTEGAETLAMNEKDDNAALRMVAEYQRQVLGAANQLADEA
jgi:flagellar protein FlgJ